MSTTLKVTHKAIGAEVRHGPYAIEVHGEPLSSSASPNRCATAPLGQARLGSRDQTRQNT
jgi:hypothetical protein